MKSFSPISVVIQTTDPTRTIGGILVQARRVGTNIPVGSWVISTDQTADYQLRSCSNTDDTVTHQRVNSDTRVFLLWRAPSDLTGGVQFFATVAINFSTYWVMLTNDQISYPVGQVP
ncbi:putative defense protein 3 isoform X1, partial [Apostichopus japonicus]